MGHGDWIELSATGRHSRPRRPLPFCLPLLCAALLGLPLPALAQLQSLPEMSELREGLERSQAAAAIPPPRLKVVDRPGDDGTGLLLLIEAMPEGYGIVPEIAAGDAWYPTEGAPLDTTLTASKAAFPQYFGYAPADADTLVVPISSYLEPAAEPGGDPNGVPLAAGETYRVRLALYDAELNRVTQFDAGDAITVEQWFDPAKLNNLLMCVIFSAIILGSIAAARRNPNLYVRRIAGLEAVDEAVGRATEMGKPVFHINGLDGLTVLSTLAGVNILGRIARITAQYETDLIVPAFDPVVLNVSQEVVRQAYLEAGRPDAFRADNIFFVTDQQFSYTASVCGMMVRDRPAAVFLLGSFYAESLMLAETGFNVGAIQIAGTDQQAQLPFFITTCDYTLIGEELYAASAYLSREPMLLGSLKGQDAGKALVMAFILIGSLLASAGDTTLIHWFTNL